MFLMDRGCGGDLSMELIAARGLLKTPRLVQKHMLFVRGVDGKLVLRAHVSI